MTVIAQPRRVGLHLSPSRVGVFVREQPLLVLLTLLAAVAYSTYSILRHVHYASAGNDLGIFDQAIWHYSRFEAPASSVRGVSNLLGDHFHPILVVLAPLYWLWSDPRTLLIAQGILVAASIVPVFLFARPRLGTRGAHLFAGAYALYWALHAGVAFDFHEVAFAPLLVALVLLFVDQRRWTAYWVASGLLLLVKEDLSLFMVFVGLYVAVLGHRRRGAITVMVGVAYFVLATKVFIPAFAGGARYQYWSYRQLGPDLPHALLNVARSPTLLLNTLFDHPEKMRTVALLLAPFLGLIVYSRLAIAAVPLLAERMLSSIPALWQADFHYSLAIAPIIAMGAADGLPNLLRILGTTGVRRAAVIVPAVALLLNAGVAARYPLASLGHPSFYTRSAVDQATDRALGLIPPHASVAAQNVFVPHLSHRTAIYEFSAAAPSTDYIVVDLSRPDRDVFPSNSFTEFERAIATRRGAYRTVFDEQGVVVLRRR